MFQVRKMSAVFALIVLVIAASAAEGGIFRRGRCRSRCQLSYPASAVPTAGDTCICPLNITESGSGSPCLWYAMKCPSSHTPVPWYGPRSHLPGNCSTCDTNCDPIITSPGPTLKDGLGAYGEPEFYISSDTVQDGCVKAAPQAAGDFVTTTYVEIKSRSVKVDEIINVKYQKAGRETTIKVQKIELEMRRAGTSDAWTKVRYGREVDTAVVPNEMGVKKSHIPHGHVFKVSHGGHDFDVITDENTIPDEP